MKDAFILRILPWSFLTPNIWLRPKRDTLLIVKLDGIGDYVLFRNFIQILKESEKFKDHRITLCANISVKDLALSFDQDWIDDVIWLDKNRFMKSLWYKITVATALRSRRFETVIHSTYSRDVLSDLVIKMTGAKTKIGDTGDLSNIKNSQKKITDGYYTQLINTGHEVTFEFLRTKKFMEKLLGKHIDLKKPEIVLSEDKVQQTKPGNVAVLFPSASNAKRRWSTEHFARLAEYIVDRYHYEVAICGAISDKPLVEEISALAPHIPISDLTGSSLSQLASTLARATIVIANDTGAMHMACAVNTNVVCISGGRHFGRYTPYPSSVYERCITVYPKAMSVDSKSVEELKEAYRYRSNLDINSVENDGVEKAINLLLG